MPCFTYLRVIPVLFGTLLCLLVFHGCVQPTADKPAEELWADNMDDAAFFDQWTQKAANFTFAGQYDSALICYQLMEARALQLQATEMYVLLRTARAGLYGSLMQPDSAYQLLHATLGVLAQQQLAQDTLAIPVLRSLSSYFHGRNLFDSTRYYQHKIYEIGRSRYPEGHAFFANYYNDLGVLFFQNNQLDSAIVYLNNSLRIRRQLYGPDDVSLCAPYHNLLVCYARQGDWEQQLACGKRALEIARHAKPTDREVLAKSLSNLAASYGGRGAIRMAEKLEREALAIREDLYPPHHPQIARSFSNLGGYAGERGDYEQEVLLLQKAIRIYEQDPQGALNDLPGTYLNLGYAYGALGKAEEQLHSYLLASELMEQVYGPDHLLTAMAYHNLAVAYLGQEATQQALEYEQKAYDIRRANMQAGNTELINSTSYMGRLMHERGNLRTAAAYYAQTQQLLDSVSQQKTQLLPAYMEIYVSVYASHFLESGRIQAAIDSLHALLRAVEGQNRSTPLEEQVWLSPAYYPVIIGTYRGLIRAQHAAWQQWQGPQYLQAMVDTYARLLRFIQQIYPTFERGGSRLSWIRQLRKGPEAEVVLSAACRLWEQGALPEETVLFIFQQTKAIELLAAYSDQQARYEVYIPDSLLKKEGELRVDLAYYQQRLAQFSQSPAHQSQAGSLRERVFQLHRQRDTLRKQLQVRFPAYYQRQYEWPVASAETIQHSILQPPGSRLLEYYWGNEQVFLLSMDACGLSVHAIGHSDSLRQDLYTFRQMLEQRPDRPNRAHLLQAYSQQATALFQRLVEPALSAETDEQLILIPDGPLDQLPFEILLDQAPGPGASYGEFPYLIRRYRIHYGYSSALLTASSAFSAANLKAFAGFVPFYEHLSHHYDERLQSTGQIAQLMGGAVLGAEEASPAAFIAASQTYRILHFAGIGVSDSLHPTSAYLLFSDLHSPAKPSLPTLAEEDLPDERRALYVYAMEALRLRAELVVLAGCETAVGPYQYGAGSLSIGSAMRRAGCGSVVASLWPVMERPTNALMRDFYAFLKAGLPKDEALRQAKLHFLQSQDELHPYYWGGFVLVGKSAPLENNLP